MNNYVIKFEGKEYSVAEFVDLPASMKDRIIESLNNEQLEELLQHLEAYSNSRR